MDSFKKLGDAIKRYMEGIYGIDKLGWVLLAVAAVSLLLASGGNFFWWLVALAALVWGWFRALSYNHEARAAENEKFLGLVNKVTSWFKGRFGSSGDAEQKVEVRCPHCGSKFNLPKGKGTLRATCPTCGEKSVHKV